MRTRTDLNCSTSCIISPCEKLGYLRASLSACILSQSPLWCELRWVKQLRENSAPPSSQATERGVIILAVSTVHSTRSIASDVPLGESSEERTAEDPKENPENREREEASPPLCIKVAVRLACPTSSAAAKVMRLARPGEGKVK